MATSTITKRFGIRRKIVTYSNIEIQASNKYVLLDNYSGLGFVAATHVVSMNVRGWSGAKLPLELLKSATGSNIYVAGEAQTITSITVEYYYTTDIETD